MTYPKKIMKTGELIKLGFTKDYLLSMSHIEGQQYCTTLPGGKCFYWDTEEFEKERLKHLVK